MMMTIKAMCTISFSQPLLVVLLVHCISYVDGIDRNLDRFNYDRTKRAGKNNVTTNDWGPKDWENTQCPDLDSCVSLECSTQFIAW